MRATRSPPSGIPAALASLGTLRALLLVIAIVCSATWLGLAVTMADIPASGTLTNRLGGVAGSDFMYFYPAGVMAAHGQASAVNDGAMLTTTGRSVLKATLPELVWPYPPTMSLLVAPLGWLTPQVALACWMGLLTLAMFAVGWLAFGSWRLALLVFLFPGTGLALFTGQVSPFVVVVLSGFFFTAERSPRLAGVLLGLLTWKPQFVIGPGLGLAAFRRWRTLLYALGGTLGLALLSVFAFGVGPWRTFLEAGLRHSQALDRETPLSRFITTFAAAYSQGLGPRWSFVLHLCVAIPAGWLALRLWRTGLDRSTRAAGLASCTLITTPYALDYDLLIFLLPWCLLIRESRTAPARARTDVWLWLGLTALVPVVYVVQIGTNRSVGAVGIIVIMAVVWWRDYRVKTGTPTVLPTS
jgi:hypothetical protein